MRLPRTRGGLFISSAPADTSCRRNTFLFLCRGFLFPFPPDDEIRDRERGEGRSPCYRVGEVEHIERRVREAGLEDCVFFMGNIADVADKMTAADAMIFPSKYEGLPTVLLEAQAAGLDAFVSDTITDEIALTGRIHPLALGAGAQAWAEAILRTKRAPNRAADNAAIRQKYDVAAVARRLTQIYTQPVRKA